ncbi:uncharacterized protein LOC112974587 [Apteryx rowi]|uniref:uncharacterized protein LOC112974587 n=1 Tax=Apteryx rowi TaxID=308060 RepID=UPI000E1E1AF9|nr:uncharacterized protein LOC112974587 [Apteryx rowi]
MYYKKMQFWEIGRMWEMLPRHDPTKDWWDKSPLPLGIYNILGSEDVFALDMYSTKLCSDCTVVSEGQGFLIKNTRLEKCIHVSHHETDGIGLTDCKMHSQQQQWSWDPATRTIVSLKTKQCLSAHKTREYALAKLEPCGDWERQAWACSKKGHLTLQSLGFHLSTKEGGHKVFVSKEKDKFSKWKTLADETICAAARTAALRPGEPTQEAVDRLVWIYENHN